MRERRKEKMKRQNKKGRKKEKAKKKRKKKGWGKQTEMQKQNKTKQNTGEYLLILYTLRPWSSLELVCLPGLLGEGPVLLIFGVSTWGSCSALCLVQGSVGVVYPVRPQEE